MTRNTEEFIRSLGANLVPVQPLRRPWIRAAIWLAFSLPYLAVMVFVMSPRNDLLSKLSDTRFVVEQIAALTTGIVAAAAAFAMVVPGYTRKLLVALLFPAAIWLGSLSRGCLLDWSQRGVGGLSLRSDWMCLPAIILMGAIPAVAMAIMLRRGAPLAPRVTTALGGLAAAGIGDFGLRLVHPEDASLMVLVWQFGVVCALSIIAGWAGRYLLNWGATADRSNHRIAVG